MASPELSSGRKWFTAGCGLVSGGLGLAGAVVSARYGLEAAVESMHPHTSLLAEQVNEAEMIMGGLGTLAGVVLAQAGVWLTQIPFDRAE